MIPMETHGGTLPHPQAYSAGCSETGVCHWGAPFDIFSPSQCSVDMIVMKCLITSIVCLHHCDKDWALSLAFAATISDYGVCTRSIRSSKL